MSYKLLNIIRITIYSCLFIARLVMTFCCGRFNVEGLPFFVAIDVSNLFSIISPKSELLVMYWGLNTEKLDAGT